MSARDESVVCRPPRDAQHRRASDIWTQTVSGRAVDLLDPTPDMIDFNDVAHHLARLARFCGATVGPYSVAQHCVLGAEYLWRRTGDRDIALAFLLHDAHEAFTGDFTTPVKSALATHARREWRSVAYDAADLLKLAIGALQRRLDEAIHAAAGLAFPLAPATAALVRDIDLRLLRAERDALMAPAPRPWSPLVERAAPLPVHSNDLLPRGAELAALEWRSLFNGFARRRALAEPVAERSAG